MGIFIANNFLSYASHISLFCNLWVGTLEVFTILKRRPTTMSVCRWAIVSYMVIVLCWPVQVYFWWRCLALMMKRRKVHNEKQLLHTHWMLLDHSVIVLLLRSSSNTPTHLGNALPLPLILLTLNGFTFSTSK